ncbi:MAG: hypothetical protein N3H31_03560 [Candidatus Nezhaarchaeota archaeon]|nr:hypothetical protein [Candidatus Nezhaarchaeota archaeon]
MTALLLETLKASVCMFATALALYLAYLYARSRAPRRPVGDKLSIYACGESYPERKASVADVNLFTAVWRTVFRGLYTRLREGVHTGILSDWMAWMLVLLVLVLVSLVVGGLPWAT